MSVYAVRMGCTHGGSTQFNVFFYRTLNPGVLEGTASDLNIAFNVGPVGAIKSRTSTNTFFNELYTYDLFFPTNINTQALSGTGAVVGDYLPPYVTATLRTNKASRVIKRGQKRIGGLAETQLTNGLLDSAQVPLFNTLGVQLAATLIGSLANYIPVVVKRIKYTPSGGGIAYRLPATLAEYSAFDVVSWTVNSRPTTQNSRKLPFV